LPPGITMSSDGHTYLGAPPFVPGQTATQTTDALDLETGLKAQVPRDDDTRSWATTSLDPIAPSSLDAKTGASRWSTTIPSSPVMNLLRVMVTGGYVVIGGGTGSN
jgi:hypothetical protein